MGKRVILILVGVAIYGILHEYFRLPRWMSGMIAFIPFALAESKGLISPYEKSARDILHEKDDSSES